MDNEQDCQKELVNTTDCLEAISVFKFWKNILFVLILICLIVLQICFWVINLDLIGKAQSREAKVPEITQTREAEDANAIVDFIKTEDANSTQAVHKAIDKSQHEIEMAAKKVAGDTNEPAIVRSSKNLDIDLGTIFKKVHFTWTIKTVDFIVILLSLAYCLLILFAFKISMVGRLGGINHIARALVLSVLFLVFLMPWQEIFGWFTAGALYAPGELLTYLENLDTNNLFAYAFFYLRFVGYWLLVLMLLISAQIRTCRWSKATLRRLEVV